MYTDIYGASILPGEKLRLFFYIPANKRYVRISPKINFLVVAFFVIIEKKKIDVSFLTADGVRKITKQIKKQRRKTRDDRES